MIRDIAAGIDSSTQSCTVVLRNLSDGKIIAQSRSKHTPTYPPCSEQLPEEWWNALIECFNNLKEYLPRIACIAVGGQGHGLVILDENFNSLRKAKLWNDTESSKNADDIRRIIEDNYWETHIGSIPGPALTISKLVWTQEHYNDILEKAKYIMLPADYLIFKLTGNFVTERGGGSGTGYLNPYTNEYDYEILKKCLKTDISSKLPKIYPSNSIAGEAKFIDELKELQGAVVGMGTGDNMAAAIGLNCKEGDTVISIGTSGTVYSVTKKAIKDSHDGMLNLYADATNRFMPMFTTLNSSKVTDAFRRILNVSFEEFDNLALSDKLDNGLNLVPYLDGERSPNLPLASGFFTGMRSNISRENIASTAVKGIVCNLLGGLDILKSVGVEDNGKIIVTGGGSKSTAYRQFLADLSSKDIYTCQYVETVAAGAALYAASSYKNIDIQKLMDEWALNINKVSSPRDVDFKSIRQSYHFYAKKYEEYIYGK